MAKDANTKVGYRTYALVGRVGRQVPYPVSLPTLVTTIRHIATTIKAVLVRYRTYRTIDVRARRKGLDLKKLDRSFVCQIFTATIGKASCVYVRHGRYRPVRQVLTIPFLHCVKYSWNFYMNRYLYTMLVIGVNSSGPLKIITIPVRYCIELIGQVGRYLPTLLVSAVRYLSKYYLSFYNPLDPANLFLVRKCKTSLRPLIRYILVRYRQYIQVFIQW